MDKLLIKLFKKIEKRLLNYKFYQVFHKFILSFKEKHPVFIKIAAVSFCLFYVIVVTYYIFHALKLDDGLPKGYDAIGHIAMIEFFKRDFPNIFWNPFWHNGIISFPSSDPLYHETLGLISRLSGISSANLMTYSTLFFLMMTVVSLFGITYLISRRLILAIASPFLLISSSAYWFYIVEAGLFLRIAGFAFYLFHVFLLLLYVFEKKEKFKKYIYPLIIFSFIAAILSHLYATIFTFITFIVITFIFMNGQERTKFWLKTFFISGGLTAFFYLPYIIFRPMKTTLIGQFEGFEYAPISLDLLLRQQYPGVNVIIIPLILILILLIIFVRNEDSEDNKKLSRYKKSFFFFSILGMAFVIYSLRIFNLSIFALYTSTALFFASIFFSLGIIFGLTLEKNMISTKMFLVLALVLSAITINSVSTLSLHTSENIIPSNKQLYLSNVDETKNYRFSSYDQNVSKGFNLVYDGLQTRGYFMQSAIFPSFNYWFEQILFNNDTAVYETKFVLDWYAINNIYLSERSTGIVRSSSEIKFDKDPDFIRDGKGYLYLKKTPIFYATDARSVFIRGKEDEYDKAIYAIASKNWSINTLVPIKTSKQTEDVIPAKSVVSGIEALGLNPKGYENSGKDLKAIYKNTQHWEVVLNKHYNGLIFKQSYFSNWKAKLIKENGRTSSLKIYMAGPGMMYVFLPEFDGAARVVFEYKHSWPEYLGFLITIGTIIFLVSSKIPQIKKLKLNEKVINLIKREMK
ncbi:MAG: hypothetical protein Q7K55_00620 [Candidatus Levybacteria bacterium]|nr:hypothetical protein [Candidatus Levybacteria bacterium]